MSRNYFAIENRTNLTKERSRAILPLLVRQAMARQKIKYKDLAEELGLHHRALRYPLGCIGDILSEMNEQWPEEIPQIQGLVVNQETGLPGDNVHFLRHRPDPREKEAIVEEVLGKVFSYSKWLDVLEELGLSPAAPLNLQFEPPANGRGPRESEAHKRLKEYVAQHPKSVGLKKSLAPGETEYRLPSGDIPDVLFQDQNCRIAVEVKSRISNQNDLRRGLFQCVKYRALLRACRSLEGGIYEADAILAIEGSFPKELIPVRNTLGIRVKSVEVKGNN